MMSEASVVMERRYHAGQKPGLREEWRDLIARRDLLWSLVQRDLTVRYKRSIIGFFWTMLNPLLMMVIFLLVFSTVFRFAIPHYETYFLSEYLPWNFFAQATVGAMASLAWNGALMKRVRVPRSIFAIATTLSGLVNLALSMLPLLLIMAFAGAPIRPAMLFLPVSFVVLGVFTLGLALVLSAFAVFFVDVREMYTVLIAALMYLTPIIYPLAIIPERYQWLIRGNPLTALLELFRAPIYYGRIPSGEVLAFASISAIVAVGLGWTIFRRLSPRFFIHL